MIKFVFELYCAQQWIFNAWILSNMQTRLPTGSSTFSTLIFHTYKTDRLLASGNNSVQSFLNQEQLYFHNVTILQLNITKVKIKIVLFVAHGQKYSKCVSLHTVLVFSISAIPVYMSSRIARRPVGPENWQYKYNSRIISIINIKLNTDPTYIIIFLPKLVLCSGVWFVHFTLSLFSILKLVDSVKTKFVCNDYRLLFAGVESA